MKTIDWKEVIKTHKTISGINCTSGLVNSLLCNTGSDRNYPNRIEEDFIFYYVNPKTQPSECKALLESISQKTTFPVFQKIAVNKWCNIGTYLVNSHNEDSGGYSEFTLVKVK